MDNINKKYDELIKYLKELNGVAVAFSGGVDSTFLVKAASEALGDKVVAITVNSPYIPKWEIEESKNLSSELNVIHKFIEVPIIEEIRYNPENRCYLCKKNVFSLIKKEAAQYGINQVIDGTNYDDLGDYRPGMKALKELDIKSPLLELEIGKEQIRKMSHMLGLVTWNKPAYACLLTRIPYGSEIKKEELIRIEESEKYIMSLGYKAIRVRCHGELARIEFSMKDMKNMINSELSQEISEKLKGFGFKYVTMDLSGYKMGSFNK